MSHPSHGAHPPGCRCSSCHISSKLFPRGPNDRIILPAIRPGAHADPRLDQVPKSPMATDRTRLAPPRPQSTAPHEYRRRAQEPPPPMPPMPTSPRYGGGQPSSSRRSMDTDHSRKSLPTPMHRPAPMYAQAPPPGPERGYRFAPPDRPASAMAAPRRPDEQRGHHRQHSEQQGEPPRLKWVQKKERVSHFTPPSQYQGTSFRQYVHDGVSSRQ
ncbi:hypothetical protein DFH07DRAFT_951395 [Mycena maculata]|uniref:Uncharacterized protein n=1 Tax=Mycena maculata TaxID=230809 RepID=A0AAD7NVJ8_9AGAR|nr:hypothetical protein DFH07DRAFT_951395 [Mycena maculata]